MTTASKPHIIGVARNIARAMPFCFADFYQRNAADPGGYRFSPVGVGAEGDSCDWKNAVFADENP